MVHVDKRLRNISGRIEHYGMMYAANNVVGQALLANVPQVFDAWQADGPKIGGVNPDTESNNVVLTEAGVWLVLFQVSFASSAVNRLFSFHGRLDGVDQDQLRVGRSIGTGGAIGSGSFSGLMESDTDQVFDVHVEADGNATLTAAQAQLSVIFLP